ncbi:hypothetical protein BC831DRAFT_440883 [Entophlyctis helioformis]|nr:hypothetical protein BC831DRAFT_440883 [Entophlyctis helioformis]
MQTTDCWHCALTEAGLMLLAVHTAMLDEHAAKPQVHEELEDLKHNYREALRLNMQLEEQLKRRASAS